MTSAFFECNAIYKYFPTCLTYITITSLSESFREKAFIDWGEKYPLEQIFLY